MITDGQSSFCNVHFGKFSTEWNFTHITSSPHHQQGNGKAEAAVKVFKNILKKSNEDRSDWQIGMLNQRNTPNKTGYSPTSRFFARSTRSLIPSLNENYKHKIPKFTEERIKQQREQAKGYYDKKVKALKELKKGDVVWIKRNPQVRGPWSKGVVQAVLKNREYLVKVNNTIYRRNRIFIKLHKQGDLDDETKSDHNSEAPAEEETININESEDEEASDDGSDSNSQYEDCERSEISADELNAPPNEPAIPERSDINENQRPRRNRQLPVRLRDYIIEN